MLADILSRRPLELGIHSLWILLRDQGTVCWPAGTKDSNEDDLYQAKNQANEIRQRNINVVNGQPIPEPDETIKNLTNSEGAVD